MWWCLIGYCAVALCSAALTCFVMLYKHVHGTILDMMSAQTLSKMMDYSNHNAADTDTDTDNNTNIDYMRAICKERLENNSEFFERCVADRVIKNRIMELGMSYAASFHLKHKLT